MARQRDTTIVIIPFAAIRVQSVADYLNAAGLDGGQPLVVLGDGHVVFDAALGAPLPVDVEQRHAGRVVLDEAHLRRDGHDARHGEVEEALGRLLVLVEVVVEHAQQLQHALLAPRVAQAGVVDHQVRVDLAVVAADVQPPRRRVVLLHDLDARQEARDAHVVVRVLTENQRQSVSFDSQPKPNDEPTVVQASVIRSYQRDGVSE